MTAPAGVNAAWVLKWAAYIAHRYDRSAKGEVLFNPTASFHLCGLIERAASVPKSGATRRRSWGEPLIQEAKAAFCRAHGVAHPDAWEWEQRRSPDEVRDALTAAIGACHA
jgi:hypothetical protein